MISLEQILNFFPPSLREDPTRQKYLLKEYIQLMVFSFHFRYLRMKYCVP